MSKRIYYCHDGETKVGEGLCEKEYPAFTEKPEEKSKGNVEHVEVKNEE